VHLQVQSTSPEKIVSYLDGPLDRKTVPSIRRKLLESAKESGIKDMVIDLSKVSTVDTAGIAMLVELLKVLSEKRAKLHLIGLNDNTTKMIRLSRLDTVFNIENKS